ncbi:hypothetical protein H0H93_000239 [Arthromyces matolae]|nr:hypothetical protein H0H93_000239 [Arthromyces matolae]
MVHLNQEMKSGGIRAKLNLKPDLRPRDKEENLILNHFWPYYNAARNRKEVELFMSAFAIIWKDRLLPDPDREKVMSTKELKVYLRSKLMWIEFKGENHSKLSEKEAAAWEYYLRVEVDRRFRRMQYFTAARLGCPPKTHQYKVVISADERAIVERICGLPGCVIHIVVSHLEDQE